MGAQFSLVKLAICLCILAAIANCHGRILIGSPVLSAEGYLIHFQTAVSPLTLWNHLGQNCGTTLNVFRIRVSLGAQRCCGAPVCSGDRYCHFQPNLTWPAHPFSLPQQNHYDSHILGNKFCSDHERKCADSQEKKLKWWRRYRGSLYFYKIQPTFNILSFSDPTSMTTVLPFSFTNLRPSVGSFFSPHH